MCPDAFIQFVFHAGYCCHHHNHDEPCPSCGHTGLEPRPVRMRSGCDTTTPCSKQCMHISLIPNSDMVKKHHQGGAVSGPTANRRPMGGCKVASAGLFWGGGGGRAVRASCLPSRWGFSAWVRVLLPPSGFRMMESVPGPAWGEYTWPGSNWRPSAC